MIPSSFLRFPEDDTKWTNT